MIKIKTILIFLILSFPISCKVSRRHLQKDSSFNRLSNATPNKFEKKRQTNSALLQKKFSKKNKNLVKPKSIRLNPKNVRISLSKEIKLSTSAIIPNFLAPEIEIDKKNADFVKILRCSATHQFVDATGTSLDEVMGRKAKFEASKDVWALAIANYRSCKVIGEQIWSPNYLDLSAKTGTFYYVVNPCITKKHSSTKKEECSFNLERTGSIKFTNALDERLRKNLVIISKITNEIDRLTGELSKLAKLLEGRIEACEDYVARINSDRAFTRGLTMMAIFGAGVGLFERGGLLRKMFGNKVEGFTGPNASVMVGLMAMNMGSMWINEAIGTTDQLNTCIVGNAYTANFDQKIKEINQNKDLTETQKTRALASVDKEKTKYIKMISRSASPWEADGKKARAKYESEVSFLQDEFGVQRALQRIDLITKQHFNRFRVRDPFKQFPEPLKDKKDGNGFDGLLIKAILKFNKALNESAKIDDNIVRLEQTLVQAQKSGIPVKDTQGMPSFLESLMSGMGK